MYIKVLNYVCVSVTVTCVSMSVSVCVDVAFFFLYKAEHNMWTKIQEYLSRKVSVTSFNDKAADELFMVLLRVCVSMCVFVYVCVGGGGVAGVNNSEKKQFVFRGRRQRHI